MALLKLVERLCICIFGLYRRYTNRIIIIIIINLLSDLRENFIAI